MAHMCLRLKLLFERSLQATIKKEGETMAPQPNKLSQQVKGWLSKLNLKNSPRPNTTGKAKDDLIPAKDKSPDDLEIFD